MNPSVAQSEIGKTEFEYKGRRITIRIEPIHNRWRITAVIESAVSVTSRQLYPELDKQHYPTEESALSHTKDQIKYQIDRTASSKA